jgi:hypothetical protein
MGNTDLTADSYYLLQLVIDWMFFSKNKTVDLVNSTISERWLNNTQQLCVSYRRQILKALTSFLINIKSRNQSLSLYASKNRWQSGEQWKSQLYFWLLSPLPR